VKRRVAVTGVGAVTPLGVGAGALIERWAAGDSGIDGGLGRCSYFRPEDHLSRKEVRRSDRYTQLALVACREALEQAGWSAGLPYAPEEVGCVIGTGIGGIETFEDSYTVLRDVGPQAISPLTVPRLMPNAVSGMLAMQHGFKGQSYGTVSACSAGAHATGTGVRMVQYGDAAACVVGGSEAAITPLTQAAFAKMGATSSIGISRPFDRRRDGFVMGEGAGVLVLEEEERALRRGAPILGYADGYGATTDAHHLTAPEPSGDGPARAIELALQDAGLAPHDIDYVNAHGTSTPLNDRSETRALKRALGDRAGELPISSLKSAIGHLLGGAGAVEAAATVLSLQRRIAPPTLNLEEPDEDLDLDYVPGRTRPLAVNGRAPVALSNSFGFGGHNAVLVVRGT
jgi:3-oxoacyl-[acyl-carrier-protein] synthase II